MASRIVEEPLFQPRKLRIVCIGAGVSGLTFAYKFKYEFKFGDIHDLTIYEKNHDVGGTWLENKYPGIACDVPAPIYTFLFEPNPDYSQFYATGGEILDYVKRTTRKYNLDKYIQFNSKILEMVWDESSGKWRIKVQQGDSVIEDVADIVVNSGGILNRWAWPDIEGLHNFKGERLHSANWNPDADWTGKRVAIIGNGSSAIQILPQMQKRAAHVTTYIRTPTWISPNIAAEYTKDGGNFKYTEEEKEEFRNIPGKLKEYRHEIEKSINSLFFAFQKDSEPQKMFRGILENSMRERLNNDPALCAKLIPDWHVGCRRLTPGPGYLEALQADNVRAEFKGIERITSAGIQTQDGKEEEFDIIVCATGFDVSFIPAWDLIGRNGAVLHEKWQEDPEAYFGICIPQFPNYFMYSGPNSPVGNGSWISAVLDSTSNFILRWVERISTTGIRTVTVREDATREYNDYNQNLLQRTVWTSGCRSWYKNGKVDGKVTALYGASVPHFWEILESFRVEGFDLEYHHQNRFRFMGNGLTERDVNGGDVAFYLKT